MTQYELRSRVPDALVAGATLGEKHLAEVLAVLSSGGGGETVILDFAGIDHATASYLKALVFGLVRSAQEDAGRTGAPPVDVFVAVGNLSKDVREELAEVAVSQRTPVIEALKWNKERITKARLHGRVDDALRETLDLLATLGKASATQLVETAGGSKIGLTGWNNRLADLHRLRLVRRTKVGRHWMYAPLFVEVARG